VEDGARTVVPQASDFPFASPATMKRDWFARQGLRPQCMANRRRASHGVCAYCPISDALLPSAAPMLSNVLFNGVQRCSDCWTLGFIEFR